MNFYAVDQNISLINVPFVLSILPIGLFEFVAMFTLVLLITAEQKVESMSLIPFTLYVALAQSKSSSSSMSKTAMFLFLFYL